MATTPIVTEVTKAQLDALVAANGLNEGLQYKVTDRDWLLVATGNNTLQSYSGTMRILNVDGLPDYISTEKLIIDTGLINTDISIDTGNPLILNFDTTKYLLLNGFVKIISTDDLSYNYKVLDNTSNSSILLSLDPSYEIGQLSAIPLYLECVYYSPEIPYKLSGVGVGANNTVIRALLYCEKVDDLLL